MSDLVKKIVDDVPVGPALSHVPRMGPTGNIGSPTPKKCVESGEYCWYVPTEYDTATHKNIGAVQIDETTWTDEIRVLTYDEQAQIESDRQQREIPLLWQAAHNYEYEQISGSAIGLLTLSVLQNLPKAGAVKQWINSIWTTYYLRKGEIYSGQPANTDFSVCGAIPYSVPELMLEAGE